MSRQTTIDRLIQIERTEKDRLDSVQSPVGTNNVKYNTAFYGREVSDPGGELYRWCVVFQWWCCQKAGIPTSIFPKAANVFAVRDWFKDKGRYFQTPMVGDMIIFKYSHIGLVETINRQGVMSTLEGNKSDRVKRIIHRRGDSDIDGYCRPEYHKVEDDVTKEELIEVLRIAFTGDKDNRVRDWAVQLDQVKKDVDAIQRKLNMNP